MSLDTPSEPYVDPRDSAYAQTLPAGERNTVLATVSGLRKPDRLTVGDGLPDLELLRLEGAGTVRLASLVTTGPLVLVFGSFT